MDFTPELSYKHDAEGENNFQGKLMKYEQELISGKIQSRYKRFFADVLLDNGDLVTAHTPNTGSMKTCWEKDWPSMVSFHNNPKRKLKYGLELTYNGKSWINVNTGLTNKVAKEAVEKKLIEELTHYSYVKPEVKIGNSRIDLLLYNAESEDHKSATEKCYVEVKNVTLVNGENALFPDAVSTRGQKHLQELIDIKNSGTDAAMLFIISREDVNSFSPAIDIDPEYAKLLKEADKAGVKILAYKCIVSPNEVIVNQKVKVIL